MYKEKQICKYQDNENKLELLRLSKLENRNGINYLITHFQVRHNRKRIDTSISEYAMRKLFATMAQNIVLQLKIY